MSTAAVDQQDSRVALLLVYGLAAFTTVLNISMMSPLLVPIAAEFSTSEAKAGQLATITAGFAFGTALLIAPVLDRYPRRIWLRVQVGLVAAAAILTATAGSFAMVMASRAMAGVGGAIIIAICYASAVENFPDARRRHRVIGMISSSATLGSILGLPIIAVVADKTDWRWATLIIVPPSLLVIAGSGQLRERPTANSRIGVSEWIRNYRVVLGQRGVASMLGVMIIILIARFGWFVYLGAYGEQVLVTSAATMGFVFATGGITHMIGSNTVPLLLAKFTPRAITALGAGLLALNLASVGLYSDKVWAVFLFVGVFGFCWAICFVSSSIYLLELMPEARSAVSAMQSAAMEFGIGAGAAIGGLLLSILNDYERMFRSLALFMPLAFLLLAASSMRPDEAPAEESSTAAETQPA